MKNHYLLTGLFSAGMLLFSATIAQPTLTGAKNNYQLNSTFTSHTYDATGVTPGSSGANVSWDFSSLTSVSTLTGSFDNPSTSPNASMFPAANVVNQSPAHEAFLILNNNEYSIVGIVQGSNDVIDNYSDPREIITFPLSYLNVENETFSGTQEITVASITYNRSGTIQIEADGYGSLIMPYGTVNNVLRVKTTTEYSDEYMGSTIATYKETAYTWWHPDIRGGLLSFSAFETLGTTTYTGTYMDESLVGVDELNKAVSSLKMYPNPAVNQVKIQYHLASGEEVRLALKNMTGQEIMLISEGNRSTGMQSETIDLSGISKGIYLVEVRTSEAVRTEKLIIK